MRNLGGRKKQREKERKGSKRKRFIEIRKVAAKKNRRKEKQNDCGAGERVCSW